MSDETNRSMGLCGTCGLLKHIHQKRDGKPICAACLGQARTAAAAASKGSRGKGMQCAAAATIALEKWVELTSDPDLKEELELLLEKISVLNVVASGGVTAAEYDLAVESVEVNPFAGVPDSGQDPLDVEFDDQDEAPKGESTEDSYEAERRVAVNPAKDAELAPPQTPTATGAEPSVSAEVKQELIQRPADKSDDATLGGVSKASRDELIEDMDFTPWEVDQVRLAPGLNAADEMNEALDQMMTLRHLGKNIE